jgi:hypothetical protein
MQAPADGPPRARKLLGITLVAPGTPPDMSQENQAMPKRGVPVDPVSGGQGTLRRRVLIAVIGVAAALLLLNAWLVSQ